MAKRSGSVGKTYLYLGGVTSRDLVLALLTREGVAKQKTVVDGTRTEKLLPSISSFLGKSKLSGIVVAQGGGSFSQTRIICTVANALVYGWGIKVAGVPASLSLAQVVARLPKVRFVRRLLPSYSGPGVG
jgi:tRNA A37 threonylcarbamoyladenosine modification protein TsaB